MKTAVEIAKSALATGDVPVGALVLNADGKQVGTGFNRREIDNDPSAHAEIIALRQAAIANNSWRLDGHTIVVTLEPWRNCTGTNQDFGIWCMGCKSWCSWLGLGCSA